jgi:rod shape-determining protein MreD
MTALRRTVAIPVALLLALLLQLVLVNRTPLPGGAAPDLVLLVVTAVGATTGPVAGMLAGFFGGLALDVAPPGGHLAGEYALVFCLAGYACGRLRTMVDPFEEHASVASLTIMAIGAVGGEAATVVLRMMVSDPTVTGQAVKHVLPGAILYDLLLSPFVLWLMSAALRHRGVSAPDPHQRRPGMAPQYGAFRLATAGAAPKLRLGGASAVGSSAPQRKEPKLRLAGANSPSSARTSHGSSPSSLPPSARRPVTVNFTSGRGAMIGGSALGGTGLFSGLASRRSGPGKGWLRSGSPRAARPATVNYRRGGPGKGWLRAGKPAKASSQRHSPGKGWLKKSKPSPSWRRKSPAKGWLGGGKVSRGNIKLGGGGKGKLGGGKGRRMGGMR